MKLNLPKISPLLTEAGWKDHKSIFANNTGLSAELRDFEAKWAAATKDTPEDKFTEAFKALLSARGKLYGNRVPFT